MTVPQQSIAVAYLRKSSGNYGYSTQYQRAHILQYAALNGFTVIREYSDQGKSGLTLRLRNALKKLMAEVVSGTADFSAILVYDVSRWGRFQDFDEGAYYEHLCMRFGIRLHYCAEPFENDGSMQSGVIKSVKRIMAAEYSRHLGELVLRGQKRSAAGGFRQGGYAGYGLRRTAVDSEGKIVAVFAYGEYKDRPFRTILVPGPEEEVHTVRRIYRLYTEEHFSIRQIVDTLNAEGIGCGEWHNGWSWAIVKQILINEKYVGHSTYNKTTCRLGRSTHLKNDKSAWVRIEGAFEKVIDAKLFAEAQAIRAGKSLHLTDEEGLGRLRWLLGQNIDLTTHVINHHPDVPSVNFYRKRFGSLGETYKRIGYTPKRAREKHS